MSRVTELIGESTAGNPKAASELLPLVYQELRSLAASRLALEKPGQTFQATALVHEAYLRLVGKNPDVNWNGRGHFFAAAAEAMRRILVENARRKEAEKHGGDRHRILLADACLAWEMPPDDLLDLDEALTELDSIDPTAASLVRLRYFAGLVNSIESRFSRKVGGPVFHADRRRILRISFILTPCAAPSLSTVSFRPCRTFAV